MAAMIAAVILAAGKSDRLGRPKQLLPYRGRSLLLNAVECAVEAPCEPVLVVLGAHADVVTPVLEGTAADTVYNKRWQEGIGSSIRVGIRTLQKRSPEAQAALLLTCDQPLLNTDVLRKLLNRFSVLWRGPRTPTYRAFEGRTYCIKWTSCRK